jgi:cytoskeletal protein RodZ
VSELGQLLKKARLEKGMSIDQLEETTKIRKRYLEAIEEGNYKILPGNFYVRAFIKSYSETVGLDSEEVMKMYRNVIPAAVHEHNVEPIRSRRRSSGPSDKFGKWASAILMWSFPLLIIGVIYYYFYSSYETENNVSDPAPITNNAEPVEPDGGKKGNEEPASEEQPAAESKPQPEPEPPKPVIALASSTNSLDTYTVTQADKIMLELKIGAGGCWIEIREGSSKGKVLTSKMYKQDEKISMELSGSVWVRLGAPPAAELKVNGSILNTSGIPNPKNYQVNLVKAE